MIEFETTINYILFKKDENLFIIDDKIYLTDQSKPENGDILILLNDNKLTISPFSINTNYTDLLYYKIIATNYNLKLDIPIINVNDINLHELYVAGYYEFTEGWYPTYNNPDNYNCELPSEPTGKIILNLDKNNKTIIVNKN